jgi:hypothetical protein
MKIFGQECEPMPADELPNLLLKAKEAPTISNTYITTEVSIDDIRGGNGEPIVLLLPNWAYWAEDGILYNRKTGEKINIENGGYVR